MSLTPYLHLPQGCLADAEQGAVIALDDRTRHHVDRVLRCRPGTGVEVADGEGRAAAGIVGPGTVVLDGPVVEVPRPVPGLHLVQAMPKGRKLDEVVRANTELGVDRITVVVAQRSVARPDDRRGDRQRQRLQEVARAAAEQSRRPWLPVVEGPLPLAELAADRPLVGVLAHPAATEGVRSVLGPAPASDAADVVGAVGPEGGWSDEDVAHLVALGLRPATLGGFVLRTEHAGFALCTILALWLGRMG